MSLNPFNNERMRLIDLKRGISLITQACLIRHQHRQRASLLSRLKARIVARENPQPPSAYTYDLVEDMYPDDLLSKRKTLNLSSISIYFEPQSGFTHSFIMGNVIWGGYDGFDKTPEPPLFLKSENGSTQIIEEVDIIPISKGAGRFKAFIPRLPTT